ncbi:hypothetical protein DJFAAGMI_02348 [Comamonas sp. PE63]|uniref:Uncharacterized protein n=1 Tax=Comamonas brasiliensis TaxID=1812482 RepID=A0ABS5LSY2_9BURK|nr:hypothetical protein [Comamonas sp. PE63]
MLYALKISNTKRMQLFFNEHSLNQARASAGPKNS